MITFPSSILELSIISDLFILAVTVESTIIVLTKSPTSAVSPPVEYIPIPYFFKSLIISSVPLIIVRLLRQELNSYFYQLLKKA
jgi:hypothetical protein